MSINALVDGTTYTGINTITAGGKTISLSESGSSSEITTQTYNISTASTLASAVWDDYISPLVTDYPAVAFVSVANYDTSDTLSIIKGVLAKNTSSSGGTVDCTRVDGTKTQVNLTNTGAHLAVGAVLTVKIMQGLV